MKERCCVGIPQPISNSSQTLWNLQSWELSPAQVCLTHWLADASIHLSIHQCIHPPTHHPSEPHLCVCTIPQRPQIPISLFLPAGCNIFIFALLWLVTVIHRVNLLHPLHLETPPIPSTLLLLFYFTSCLYIRFIFCFIPGKAPSPSEMVFLHSIHQLTSVCSSD